MAIRITRVYTRRGDHGETDLVGGERAAKDAARIEAYGTVDELNAALGAVRAFNGAEIGRAPACRELDAILCRIQSELFDLGAELATRDGQPLLAQGPLPQPAATVTRQEAESAADASVSTNSIVAASRWAGKSKVVSPPAARSRS